MEPELNSLWGEEFSLPKTETKKILEKIKKPKEAAEVSLEKQLKSKKLSIEDRLEKIKQEVLRILGKQKDNTLVIRTKQQLVEYIDKAIENGRIDIDTETNNSLDPITCKLMGLCLYTPGLQQAYVPVNHTDLQGNRLTWQLTEADLREQLKRVVDAKKANAKALWQPDYTNQSYDEWFTLHVYQLLDVAPLFIYHNGKFDYQVIKCTCGISLPIDWDTMIGCKLINEKESASLKWQYVNKIDPEQEKYDIENLFDAKHVEFAVVDPEIFALYAATDAMMTDKLYLYQREVFSQKEMDRVFNNVFKRIEIPAIIPVAEMELTGAQIDQQYAARLKTKYTQQLAELDQKIDVELDKLKDTINEWRLTPEANVKPKKKTGEGLGKSKAELLDDPITLTSPTQLAILFYDILKFAPVDVRKPRGTGEEELIKLAQQNKFPLGDLMVERRGLVKLITSFLETIPEAAKQWPDGRVRTHYNQYGADTGRFSSSQPVNFQQLPSHQKDIRMLFEAKSGYMLVGADFSQQEPRLLSAYAQEKNMIQAYKDGKDLYATIASGVYHNDYWDNMEHHQDGSANPEGKARRSNCKSILLGILYGRGVASIAEQIHSTAEEAKKIVDNFYQAFPQIKDFAESSKEFGHQHGYVEDFWGRRRHVPDIQLPKYEVKASSNASITNFNPLLGCENRADPALIEKYLKLAEKIRSKKEYEEIQRRGLLEGVELTSNTAKIAEAERQCVNSRIQGSAASMSKQALTRIYYDPEMRQYDFHSSIMVHDEIIGECRADCAEQAANRLSYLMRTCVEKDVPMVFKCDATIEKRWYQSDYADVLREDFEKAKESGLSESQAFEQIQAKYSESSAEELRNYLNLNK